MLSKSSRVDRQGVELAYLCLFLLLLPTVIFLTNAPVWDDPIIFEKHSHWDWGALLGPFAINKAAYWRPLTVLSIAVPNLLGVSIWANKLINLILMFVQGCLAITLLNDYLRAKSPMQNSFPLIILAILLALHPIFVEATLWLSARADLLMGVFVMLGVVWICRSHQSQANELEPSAGWKGLFAGFFITWLACASKDTATVWAGLGFIAATTFCLLGKAAWRKYWGYVAAGIIFAVSSYLLVRGVVLGQINGLSSIPNIYAASVGGRFEYFTELIFRAILGFFLPFLDSAPFKSAGWFTGIPTVFLAALLLVCGGGACFFCGRVFKNNKVGGYLLLCAAVVIVLYSLLATFSELTVGGVLPDRYCAPSAILIYVVLAMGLQKKSWPTSGNRFERINIPVLAVFGVLLIQSLLLWSSTKMSWGSNLALWESAWDQGSQSRIVAESYIVVKFRRNDISSARSIAQIWLAHNRKSTITSEYCKLYLDILESDLNLGDQEDGIRYAKQSIPIGSCTPKLAMDIAFFLMDTDCKAVLPMIYLTIERVGRSALPGKEQTNKAAVLEQLLIKAATGEARCGDENKALGLLDVVAMSNPEWARNGEKARKLLTQAQEYRPVPQ